MSRCSPASPSRSTSEPVTACCQGSFVVAGSGGYQATGVGADAYARKLAAQARRFAPVRSELVDGINRILRYVTWAIAPVAVLLVISQLHGHRTLREAAVGTVAALVGMVPQGLVLLTSVAFDVAAVTPARCRVLVQQLPRSRAWPGWTWCAWTRPAPSPTGPSRSTA
jgi:cation-transporting P-type ATPase E